MQVNQLKAFFETYSAALADAGAIDVASRVQGLANSLGKGSTLAVPKLISAIDKAGFEGAVEEEPLLGHLVSVVEHLIPLLKQAGVKQAFVGDLELLLDLARRHSEVSLRSFESSVEHFVASAS